jgi:poly(A) polymerase
MRAANALPVILPSLASALEKAEDGRRRSFFQHLSALDRLVRSGEEVSEAVLLGALLMHLHGGDRAPPADGPDGAPRPAADDEAGKLLELLVQSSRLPRKVAERTRLALQAQRVLREPAKKRRRRGRGLSGQPHFVDALQLLEITVGATGKGQEILDRWAGEGAGDPDEGGGREEREPQPRPLTGPSEEPVAPFEAAEAEEEEAEVQGELELDLGGGSEAAAGTDQGARPEGSGAGRRRRRRGGRRRRRRGAAGEAGPASGGSDQGGAPAGGGGDGPTA